MNSKTVYAFGELFEDCDDEKTSSKKKSEMPDRIYLPDWVNGKKNLTTEEMKFLKETKVTTSSAITIEFDDPFPLKQTLAFRYYGKPNEEFQDRGFNLNDVVDCIARGYRMLFDEAHWWAHRTGSRINTIDTNEYDFVDMYLEEVTFDKTQNLVTFSFGS